jgi:hypothetical protein
MPVLHCCFRFDESRWAAILQQTRHFVVLFGIDETARLRPLETGISSGTNLLASR